MKKFDSNRALNAAGWYRTSATHHAWEHRATGARIEYNSLSLWTVIYPNGHRSPGIPSQKTALRLALGPAPVPAPTPSPASGTIRVLVTTDASLIRDASSVRQLRINGHMRKVVGVTVSCSRDRVTRAEFSWLDDGLATTEARP